MAAIGFIAMLIFSRYSLRWHLRTLGKWWWKHHCDPYVLWLEGVPYFFKTAQLRQKAYEVVEGAGERIVR